jgi:hypothetical protein
MPPVAICESLQSRYPRLAARLVATAASGAYRATTTDDYRTTTRFRYPLPFQSLRSNRGWGGLQTASGNRDQVSGRRIRQWRVVSGEWSVFAVRVWCFRSRGAGVFARLCVNKMVRLRPPQMPELLRGLKLMSSNGASNHQAALEWAHGARQCRRNE